MIAIRPPEYTHVTDALEPILRGLPPVVVAISGAQGSGKSTLGRYLAWCFNSTLIETDSFIKSGPPLKYRSHEIERILDFRARLHRPVIIEGVRVVDLLMDLKKIPAFHIRVRNTGPSGSVGQVDGDCFGADIPCLQVSVNH